MICETKHVKNTAIKQLQNKHKQNNVNVTFSLLNSWNEKTEPDTACNYFAKNISCTMGELFKKNNYATMRNNDLIIEKRCDPVFFIATNQVLTSVWMSAMC